MGRVKNLLEDKEGEPARLLWAAYGVLFLIIFCSFCYEDTKSIIHYEINFMDSILNGDGIQNFYEHFYLKAQEYEAAGIKGTAYATYDFPVYLVLGIWGIPLYFVCAIMKIEATESMLCMLYGKAIYLVALYFAVRIIERICLELQLTKANSKWASFLFTSSLLTITCIGIMGQSDILGIVLILYGILLYLQRKWIVGDVVFAIAVTFKLYALFIFVPLLLLREKRIFRIIGGMILAVLPMLLGNVIFLGNTNGMQAKAIFSARMASKLTAEKLPNMGGDVCLIVLLMGLLCVWCYMAPEVEDSLRKERMLFTALLALSIVFTTFNAYPYWFLYLCPFMSVMLAGNGKYRERLFVLETIGIAALVGAQFLEYHWCFDIGNTEYMLLEKIFGPMNFDMAKITFGALASYLDSTKIRVAFCSGMLKSIYLVCQAGFVYYCRPSCIPMENEGEIAIYAGCRCLVNVVVAYIPVLVYVLNLILIAQKG